MWKLRLRDEAKRGATGATATATATATVAIGGVIRLGVGIRGSKYGRDEVEQIH